MVAFTWSAIMSELDSICIVHALCYEKMKISNIHYIRNAINGRTMQVSYTLVSTLQGIFVSYQLFNRHQSVFIT